MTIAIVIIAINCRVQADNKTDGNVYPTTTTGTQAWTVENDKVFATLDQTPVNSDADVNFNTDIANTVLSDENCLVIWLDAATATSMGIGQFSKSLLVSVMDDDYNLAEQEYIHGGTKNVIETCNPAYADKDGYVKFTLPTGKYQISVVSSEKVNYKPKYKWHFEVEFSESKNEEIIQITTEAE